VVLPWLRFASLGYLVYDLCVPIEHGLVAPDAAPLRQALLDGYAEVRDLPVDQFRHLDAFVAGRSVGNANWVGGCVRANPSTWPLAQVEGYVARAAADARVYLEGRSPVTGWVEEMGWR